MKIFVYGTLKGGLWNNDMVLREGDKFLGAARTLPIYDLKADGIPYLCPEGEHAIAGEVYDVSEKTLHGLDMMEGHPDWYQRRPVALQDGTPEGDTSVQAYFYPHTSMTPVWRETDEEGALNWR